MREKEPAREYSQAYIKNIFRIILLASISICLAVIITGFLSYNNTKKSLVRKVKSQDIVFIVKSMAEKIDGRINKAVETSRILASDPQNIQWAKGEDKGEETGNSVLKKLLDISHSYDYSNTFLSEVNTKHYYYSENLKDGNRKVNSVFLSENNSADAWFFDMLKTKKQLMLNVNYDRAMDDYFLFVDCLMGTVDAPIGICGVGLSLNDIAKEFQNIKVGEKSNLWMIDEKGIIQLSDIRDNIGKNYDTFLPKGVIEQIQSQSWEDTGNVKVSEYENAKKQTIDYAYYKLPSYNWILFYEIPRKESLSMISSLGINTAATIVVVLICFTVLFYFISKKIADPYKQTVLMNKELEIKVNVRTQELKESNDKILESIGYAKRLQETILPSEQDMERVFKDNFVIWMPRDIVGGDFFWLREIDDTAILAIGDCTGHGVPGALMTMTVNAILHNIVTTVNKDDPSIILRELHRNLRQTLNKSSSSEIADDGLDVAIICIKNKTSLLYAGANIGLYVKNAKEIRYLSPQSRGVGYSFIDLKDSLTSEVMTINDGDIFIASTDGFLHQNGGQKNYPFGKKRMIDMIKASEATDLDSMKVEFENMLNEYMKEKEQRDDITMVSFKVK